MGNNMSVTDTVTLTINPGFQVITDIQINNNLTKQTYRTVLSPEMHTKLMNYIQKHKIQPNSQNQIQFSKFMLDLIDKEQV